MNEELEREMDREDYTFFVEPFDEQDEHRQDLEVAQTGEAIEIIRQSL